jgi:hypothetical protein
VELISKKIYPQLSWLMTRKKSQQHDDEEDLEEEHLPEKVGHKSLKDKQEEATNKEKKLGIQKTIESSMGYNMKLQSRKSQGTQSTRRSTR